MMLFRPAEKKDLEAIHALALQSGIGMLSLPRDIEILQKRLNKSCDSFEKKVIQPQNECYLFVLEDTDTQQIVGTSGIEAFIGHDAPFYAYKISRSTRAAPELNIQSEYDMLTLVDELQGYSEICTLYLKSEYRKNCNGLLLSRARFLFMAQHPIRFAPKVIAEMRGVSDKEGRCPFWDRVMYPFFKIPFPEAVKLLQSTSKQKFVDLMPKKPFYVPLMHPEAQAVIGKPHPSTEPALKILQQEGFQFNYSVDIFDAGPNIEAPLKDIKTVSSSHLFTINNFSDAISGARYILANPLLNFRATIGQIAIDESKKTCSISPASAELLNLQKGDTLRVSLLQLESEINASTGEISHAEQ